MNELTRKHHTIPGKQSLHSQLVVTVVTFILLSCLISSLSIFWLSSQNLMAYGESAQTTIENLRQHLGLSIMLGHLLSFLLAAIIATVTVKTLSHRIVGPISRFETLCQEVGKGNLDANAQLREADHLQELSQAFAEMLHNLKLRSTQRSRLIEQITHQIGMCALKSGDELSPELSSAIASLTTILAELEKLETRREA